MFQINPRIEYVALFVVYRVILYLKMFMGMGFFWTSEIVAGLSGDDTHDSAVW